MQRGLPELIERGPLRTGQRPNLLPTPTQLLPTPRTSDGRGPAAHGQGGVDLRTMVSQLLPTPKASDGIKGCPGQRGSKGDLTLPSAAVHLSSTAQGNEERDTDTTRAAGRRATAPRTSITGTASRQLTNHRRVAGHRQGGHAGEQAETVPSRELALRRETPAASQPAAHTGAWGRYAEAVARWEQLLGRAAPAPTQPGKHGKPVLAPVFVEWLMGLDPGWVSDLPLPRTLALRVLGNGVVPQQAAVALALLLCPYRWVAES